ncbi:DUF7535 family protein [Halorussus ruber]|uniref:DUF7535 family protein n=1 Tax=Halorussus ruber TaxID=1126238 RepID=UPI00143DE676|nr:hypothetical protein [Halorussus ruber]
MTDQVSKMEGMTPNSQMGLFGYLIAAGVGFLLIPISPFLLALWLLTDLGGSQNEYAA